MGATTLETRKLDDLRGIGKRMLGDFAGLGVHSVQQLKTQDPKRLYEQLCEQKHARQDPCVLDTFVCAVKQARNPNLPREQRDWWYWSAVRKKAERR
jgi:Pathogenicity locus